MTWHRHIECDSSVSLNCHPCACPIPLATVKEALAYANREAGFIEVRVSKRIVGSLFNVQDPQLGWVVHLCGACAKQLGFKRRRRA